MKRISILIIAIIIISCTSQDLSKFCGTWVRDVADTELGINGIECISIHEDSSVVIVNKMTMIYADSILKSEFNFTTSISGLWQYSEDNIDVSLDIETYKFAVDSTKTSVTAIGEGNVISDEAVKHLLNDLSAALSDFYKCVYVESPQISIKDVLLLSNGRLMGNYGESSILWHQVYSHN